MRKKIMDINILSVEEIFIEMQKARLEERSCFYFRHQLADGKVVDVEVFNGPITIKGKGLLFSIIHDISQRKKAEKQIQAYQERLRSLSSELTLAEARERGRIASILHDNIGQDLALSLIKLGSVRREAYSAGMLKPLDEVAALIEKAIHDTQTLTFDLSFISLLKRFGYERAIAEWLEKHVQQGHGLKTHFKDDGREKPLGDDVRILLFEAVRELLVNVIKHAQAENIWIDIRKKDTHIEVDVKDDGVGMEVYDAEQFLPRFAGGGFGLFSIRERLNDIGGKLSIHSKKGLGTRVTLEAPLKLES
jgi:signal transduction histidine kinase